MINLQTKRKANTDGCSHFSKGSLLRVPPALTEEEWDVQTYCSPFQKGLQDTRKLRCCSIQLDFVAKGCTGNLLNTKPKPMILNAFFGYLPISSRFKSYTLQGTNISPFKVPVGRMTFSSSILVGYVTSIPREGIYIETFRISSNTFRQTKTRLATGDWIHRDRASAHQLVHVDTSFTLLLLSSPNKVYRL